MLQHMIVAAALTVAVLPAPTVTAPSPQPSATPMLKTIANVRSSTRCATIITHANSAISTALNNDQIIGQTITQLRFTNLDDGNPIHRKKGLDALGDLAKNLMLAARAGDDEVKRLRKLASESKDPDEAKALKDFADELGGALWSQQKIARDLNGFLAYQDFRDMAQWDDGQKAMNEANFGVPDPQAQIPQGIPGASIIRSGPNAGQPATMAHPFLGHNPYEANATQQAKWAAEDFQNRIPVIMRDENLAAGKVDGAIKGC
jgi:hypothetical protein